MTEISEQNVDVILDKAGFNAFEYYKFTREEVKREDDLTNHRITSSLTLQGFLIASSGFVVSRFVDTSAVDGKLIYMAIIMAIGLIGLFLSFYSMMGVFAARNSIDNLLRDWRKFDRIHGVVPDFAPHFVGTGSSFKWGSRYYKAIPLIMFVAWVSFVSVFSLFFIASWLHNDPANATSGTSSHVAPAVPIGVHAN